ncbi:glutaminyl-peptide cyclotransferase [Nonlabens sp. Hel1_33_55]|uniref:glutaminyl-peptide cyclotransferase n=1 Tax=Nonlabens sp. Hel1_33_55 TaxID=1336802 RepID=UPI000875D5ED|nr:glutaminyl-peptide cyclotransferase [Nonlabens sp. Hel1_33_55]SCX97889.1 glutaminyl-peptide cyclotransferase [Nonlabens sp. Hel1_33_55]
MNWKYSILIAFVALSLSSCKTELDRFKSNYSLEITNDKKNWNDEDTVQISLVDDASMGADSIVWYQNARRLDDVEGNTLSRNLTNQPLGKLTYKAVVYQDNKVATATTSITRLNPIAPKIYSYSIVNTYPHDEAAYTQGLEFHDGQLYESTGQYGESDVRITQVETGDVIKKEELGRDIFAEGLTILNNKLYQLTWRSRFGYVYDLDLNETETFKYNQSKEGWGLANDGEFLYKSDGTDKIWKIDPVTFEELEYIQIVSNKKTFDKINELEFVNGKIYANIYQENAIFTLDPSTGALEGVINLTDLKDQIPNWSKDDNVLNGIAYDKATDRLFVTGKRWAKMFEIEISN